MARKKIKFTLLKLFLAIFLIFIMVFLGLFITNLTNQSYNIGTINNVKGIMFSLDSNLEQGNCKTDGYDNCYYASYKYNGALASSKISNSFLGVENNIYKFKYLCEGDSATLNIRDEANAWTTCGEAGCPGFPLDLKGEISYTKEELSLYSSDGKNVYLYFDCFDSDLEEEEWQEYEKVWITEFNEQGEEVKGYWDEKIVETILNKHTSWVWSTYRLNIDLTEEKSLIADLTQSETELVNISLEINQEPMPITKKKEYNIIQKFLLWIKSLFGGEQ